MPNPPETQRTAGLHPSLSSPARYLHDQTTASPRSTTVPPFAVDPLHRCSRKQDPPICFTPSKSTLHGSASYIADLHSQRSQRSAQRKSAPTQLPPSETQCAPVTTVRRRSPKQARSAVPPNRTAEAPDPSHVVDLPDPHVTGLPEPQTCSTAGVSPNRSPLPEPPNSHLRLRCTAVHQEPKNHGWPFISPTLASSGRIWSKKLRLATGFSYSIYIPILI